MLGSGFSNTPVSKFVFFSLITTSILAGITDSKHYFYIEIVPHLYPYQQVWRLLTWQLAYTSSTSLLTASITLYHLRLIERLWGSRKFAVSQKFPTHNLNTKSQLTERNHLSPTYHSSTS